MADVEKIVNDPSTVHIGESIPVMVGTHVPGESIPIMAGTHIPEENGPKIVRCKAPDAQPFDEVSIITVPRYKTSSASGNEWRISAKVQLKRKGVVVHEEDFGKLEPAVMQVASVWYAGIDSLMGYMEFPKDVCDQQGCSEPSVLTYRLKQIHNRRTQEVGPVPEGEMHVRKFCGRHWQRGDCGLEDADDNYVLVEGSTLPSKLVKTDVSVSKTMFM